MHPVWSQKQVGVRGLALAREPLRLLTWDAEHLVLWDAGGRCLTRKQAATTLAAACTADDGQTCAAAGADGRLWSLSEELRTRWEAIVPHRPVALALSPLGEHLAVSDASGGLQLHDASGQVLWRTLIPRPLERLAFVPERPLLVGCADTALVVAFDLAGRQAWRDSIVAHLGSLSVSGDGDLIALACYSEGVCFYDRQGRRRPPLTNLAPAARVVLSYDSSRALIEDPEHRVTLRTIAGGRLGECPLEARPVGLVLDALGRLAFGALADGTVAAFRAAK